MAFEARIYDPRVGRFLSVDPLTKNYPHQSPYVYAANNPIRFIDALGMASDDPPGWWKSFLIKTGLDGFDPTNASHYRIAGEGILENLPRKAEEFRDKAGASVVGTLHGYLPGPRRSAEDMGVYVAQDYFETGVDYGQAGALVRSFLPGGGLGPSPQFATSTGGQLTVATKLDVLLKSTVVLLANATGNTQAASDAGENASAANDTPDNGSTPANRRGQQMHKEYKADVANGVDRIKEFRLPSGDRIDFLDIQKDVLLIHELKPDNKRQIRQGLKQLERYKEQLENIPRFIGKKIETILDTYK